MNSARVLVLSAAIAFSGVSHAQSRTLASVRDSGATVQVAQAQPVPLLAEAGSCRSASTESRILELAEVVFIDNSILNGSAVQGLAIGLLKWLGLSCALASH